MRFSHGLRLIRKPGAKMIQVIAACVITLTVSMNLCFAGPRAVPLPVITDSDTVNVRILPHTGLLRKIISDAEKAGFKISWKDGLRVLPLPGDTPLIRAHADGKPMVPHELGFNKDGPGVVRDKSLLRIDGTRPKTLYVAVTVDGAKNGAVQISEENLRLRGEKPVIKHLTASELQQLAKNGLICIDPGTNCPTEIEGIGRNGRRVFIPSLVLIEDFSHKDVGNLEESFGRRRFRLPTFNDTCTCPRSKLDVVLTDDMAPVVPPDPKAWRGGSQNGSRGGALLNTGLTALRGIKEVPRFVNTGLGVLSLPGTISAANEGRIDKLSPLRPFEHGFNYLGWFFGNKTCEDFWDDYRYIEEGNTFYMTCPNRS